MRRSALLLLPLLAACGSGSPQPPRAKAPVDRGGGLAKCSVAASHSNPLVTEWPASEKANLEARLREGPVVVQYSGCSLRLLSECRPPKGKYVWKRTTLASDVIDIRSEDELFAKLPLGAASLEAQLRDSGRLAVQTTVAGQMSLEGLGTAEVPRDEACEGATHLVASVAMGAFKLKAGGELAASGGVGTPVVGAGAKTASSELVVKEAGDPARCAEASSTAPSDACATPVQLFMWPLPKAGPKTLAIAKKGDAPVEVGPDTVNVTFATDRGDRHYAIKIDGEPACTTPCTRGVRTGSYVEYSLANGAFYKGFTLEGVSPGDSVRILPRDRSGAWGTGFLLATLGGTGTYAGGLLYLIGSVSAKSKRTTGDEAGVEKAESLQRTGLYVGLGGIAALITGIILVAPGKGTLEVEREGGHATRLGPGYLTGQTTESGRFVLTPLGAAGTF